MIRELLFADGCALAADSADALQRLCDCFSSAARRFGLTISIKKTEVLYQPARGNADVPPAIFIEGTQLKAVQGGHKPLKTAKTAFLGQKTAKNR